MISGTALAPNPFFRFLAVFQMEHQKSYSTFAGTNESKPMVKSLSKARATHGSVKVEFSLDSAPSTMPSLDEHHPNSDIALNFSRIRLHSFKLQDRLTRAGVSADEQRYLFLINSAFELAASDDGSHDLATTVHPACELRTKIRQTGREFIRKIIIALVSLLH
jgi:hypothetical protein